MGGIRSKKYTVTKSSHADAMQRKREERAMKRAHATQRKGNTYMSDDENLNSWKIQLNKLGLELRDIPADGNCLFRALADQMDGRADKHMSYRAEVCHYMTEHQADFSPFLDEGISFDKYVSQLRKAGTFAGNDALVAFSRLQDVTIVIHQLDSAYFSIGDCTSRELHLTYHNGEHYSSVRRIGDRSTNPAHIKFKSACQDSTSNTVEQLIRLTSCEDREYAEKCLRECDGDLQTTADYMNAQRLSDTASYTSVGSCPSHGSESSAASTASGGDSGICTCDSSSAGSSSLSRRKTVSQNSKGDSKQEQKRLSKTERKRDKKKRAEDRHKQKHTSKTDTNNNEPDHEIYEIESQVALLSV